MVLINLFLEYSDDSEEVFEKETFDDFDRTVSKYLDELETQSPKLQHTWSPILESPWSSNPKLDLDEFRYILKVTRQSILGSDKYIRNKK